MNNKAQLRAAFKAGGAPAARKKGQALGMKGATIEAYIKRFEAGKELDDKPEPRSAGKAKEPRQLRKLRFGDDLGEGVAVMDIGDPRNAGTITKHGPEVSLVDFGTGPAKTVSNAYLLALSPDEAKRAAQIKRQLASLVEARVWVVKKWLAGKDKRPDDRAIWQYIINRWPSVSKKDLEPVYQET